MNKKILLWVSGMLLLLCGCREEFDSYYHDVNDASIGQSVTQVLEEKGDFGLFLQMIRRADLERALSQSGLYTCLAPKDEYVQPWLDANGWTVATMPENKLIEFINYHFILGMNYYYDFQKPYENAYEWATSPISYNIKLVFGTRTSGKAYPSKKIRIYTNGYLDVRSDDYRKIAMTEPGDFMIENVPISATERDIPTSNGVIHVLDGPLLLTPRMDEVMEADPELSIITSWFNRFKGYATIGMENDKLDTTLVKYYDVSVKPAGKVMNIADEDFTFISLMPTDAAMKAYFEPYLTPDQLVEFDSVPNELVVPFLRALVYNYSYVWGLSDIARNMPYFTSFQGDFVSLKNDIPGMYKEALISSNSTIYKLNKVPEIPLMSSLAAGYYIRYKHYRQCAKLFDKAGGNIESMFGVSNSYQHQARVMLLPPDDSKAWDNGTDEWGTDGYADEYLDTLAMRVASGFLLTELEDNQFTHCYYPASYGYILCEMEGDQPVFSDYQGKKVHLLSPEPVWTADQGAMYDVDGIFNALLPTDTTALLYRKYIEKDENLVRFKELIEQAKQEELLDRIGNFYTVFAPSNSAFEGKNISSMTEDEALKLLTKCIVPGRRIFTDGVTQGVVNLLDGKSTRTLSGAWDSFTIRSQYGVGRTTRPEECNLQGSNGVLHVIDKLLEN